jgi:tetratricopeptide (TPR) repeat protein
LGVLQTADRLGDIERHKAARQQFDVATKHLDRVIAIAKERGGKGGPLPHMVQVAQQCTERLKSPAPFLASAIEFSRHGKVQEAWSQLNDGLQRHPAVELWLARVEAGRRARMEASSILAELDGAVVGGVVRKDDYRVSLVRTKVSLPGVWKTISQSQTAQQPAPVLEQAVKELQRDEGLLRQASGNAAGDPPAQAQANAFLALAIAYNAMITRSDANTEGRLKEGYRLARDAAAALELQLRTPSDNAQEMASREALVASRLALGYLAVRVLPDYRDEAMLAFAAAFDEMARLPFLQADVKLLGSPMLAAVARRTGEAGTRLAMEERRQRQAMTLCAEAALALHFGHPAAAAEQMKAAVRAADEGLPTQQTEGLPNAAQLLNQADGFEAKVALRDSMRAFKALADVAAGRQREALRECLGVLVPESMTRVQPEAADFADDAILTQAISRVQSPVLGHALAVSLDACCDCLPVGPNPKRDLLVRHAKAAQKRTEELFASLPLKSRYPHVATMNQEIGKRLAAVDHYLQSATTLRRRGDLAGATGHLEEGLKRHSDSPELWRTLLEVQIEDVQQGGGTADGYTRIIDRLAVAEQQRLLTDYLVSFYRGTVYERMGKPDEALEAYDKAISQASAPADRVRARSKAAALRAKSVTPHA